MTFDISCNRIVGGTANSTSTTGMFFAKGNGGGNWSGAIVNNVIGPSNPASAGADGLFARAAGSGTISLLIRDNTTTDWGNVGIHLQNNDGSATMNASIFGNTAMTTKASPFAAMFLDNGATATDTSTMNVVVGSAGTVALQNTLSAPGGVVDASLSRFAATTDFNLSQNGSSQGPVNGASNAQVTTVIQDDNVGSPSVDTSGGGGLIDIVASLPTVPATPTACLPPP